MQGDDQKATIEMKITMNGVSRVVPFAYTATPEGEVVAKGSIDMLDFALKDAHDSIHQTCEELHRGKDGVSKTWTEVDLTVTGRFASRAPEHAAGAPRASAPEGGEIPITGISLPCGLARRRAASSEEEAPRAGFEPATTRLTVERSTN